MRSEPLSEDEVLAKAKAARKRLKDDVAFFSEKALKIRTKAGDITPLRFNKAQKILLEACRKQLELQGYIRVIILKARQQGLSTAVGALLYHNTIHRTGAKSLVLAHKAESTSNLFSMVKRYHDQLHAALQPSTRYSNKRELTFDKLDSSYVVATAGGDAVARGDTFTGVHASEMAFWPKSSAAEIWNGIDQAVGEIPGTMIFIESTANGVSGLFYDLWRGATEPDPDTGTTNGYAAVFIPWFIEDGYTRPPAEGFRRTLEEDALAELALEQWQHEVTDGQLQWRREKIAKNGRDLFKQEYPATPDEAFLTTGRPVFDTEQLHELLKTAPDPEHLPRLALEGTEDAPEWRPHPRGELLVYRPQEPGEQYCIGADVALGVRGGDWSVAQVLDSQKRLVATWRAHLIPDEFARVLSELGKYYNVARLSVENNNHGILTCHQLAKVLQYPNLYTTVLHNQMDDKETQVAGFSTNIKTRPMVIDELRAAMRDREITVQDKITLREMQTFIVNEAGKMEAEQGSHDDCVMALAIANHAHQGIPRLIDNDDAYYFDGY